MRRRVDFLPHRMSTAQGAVEGRLHWSYSRRVTTVAATPTGRYDLIYNGVPVKPDKQSSYTSRLGDGSGTCCSSSYRHDAPLRDPVGPHYEALFHACRLL